MIRSPVRFVKLWLLTELARGAYAVTHVVAIVAFLYSGWWRRLPMLFAAICAGSLVAVYYKPEDPTWWTSWYLYVEPIAVACRFLAVCEVTAIHGERRTLTVGSAALLGVAVAIAIWRLDPGYPMLQFIQARRYIQIGTAVTMISGLLTLWGLRLLRRDAYAFYAAVLTILVWKQATYSLLSILGKWGGLRRWLAADWPGLLISSLCLLTWTALALHSSGRSVSRSREADRQI